MGGREVWRKSREKRAGTRVRDVGAQAAAGAEALMIFDSWAGLLGPEQYREFAFPAVRRVIDALRPLDVPLIYFPNQGATLLQTVAECPPDVIGLDRRLPPPHAPTHPNPTTPESDRPQTGGRGGGERGGGGTQQSRLQGGEGGRRETAEWERKKGEGGGGGGSGPAKR